MTLLAAEAADLARGHADDTGARERGLHVVQLERLDDRFDLLHRSTAIACVVRSAGVSWTNNQPPTAKRRAAARAAAILQGQAGTTDPRSFTLVPSRGPRGSRVASQKNGALHRAPLPAGDDAVACADSQQGACRQMRSTSTAI